MLLTANAQNAGDYVYTDNGRFKIVSGENLLANGDFSNGLSGWTTDGGSVLSTDTFSIETENDNNYLVVNLKDNGPGTGSSLFQKIQVEAGKSYIMTYQVKGNDENVAATVTSASNAKNYQNFLFSLTGNPEDVDNVSLGKEQTYNFEWTTFTYGYTPQSDGFILVHFYAPYLATAFDNFKILEAQEVVDDRSAAEEIALLQSYLDNPLFPNNHEVLESAIEAFRGCVETDELEMYNELVNYIDEAINEFLNANTGNLTSFVPNLTLDDVKTTGANQTSAGAWIIDDALRVVNPTGKTRWSVKSASETNAPFAGNYFQNDIPYGSKNKLYEATVHQTVDNMPAGQYMLTVKLRGYRFTSKTATTTDVRGMKVFINNDSTECHPVKEEKVSTYIAYSKMDEAGKMKLGFYIPDSVANHVDLDFVDLRIIGWTQEQVEEYFLGKEFAEARQMLKQSIDSARVLYANQELLYGKVRLDSAIVASQDYYDNITVTDSLDDSRSRLNKEITRYIGSNGALTTLRQAIANAKLMLADNSYSESDKQPLRTAIDAAEAYISTLTADNHEEPGYTNDDINAQTALLNTAVNSLLSTQLTADENYEFLSWAQADGAEYSSLIATDAVMTSSDSELYTETANFAGHSLNGRLAFRNDLSLSLSETHGLQVTYASKNATTMAILNLKEGDQVTMDWVMGNSSHNIMISSANARVKQADGTWLEYTKKGKDNANIVPKDNADGLSASVRSTFVMNAEGTLDLYQGSSNSTIRIYYIGITEAANVVTGIQTVSQTKGTVRDGAIYDLSGRRVAAPQLKKGVYVSGGRKFVVR